MSGSESNHLIAEGKKKSDCVGDEFNAETLDAVAEELATGAEIRGSNRYKACSVFSGESDA